MTFFIISLVAGVLTVLAPCILPLLPVIVGRSVTDPTVSKRRLFTVVLALGASVILFTLLLKATTLLIDIPQDVWKWVSAGIIFFFGLTMIFPKLWDGLGFVSRISAKSNQVLGTGYQKNNFWGDVIVGASLGPIFSACSPTYFVILATVLPATPILGMFYLLAYTLGLCLALLVVALLGQKIVEKLGGVSNPNSLFKKIFGLIFILVAAGIASGYDKELQVKILDAGFLDVTKIEQKLLDENEASNEDIENPLLDEEGVRGGDSATTLPAGTPPSKGGDEQFLTLAEKKKKYQKAPDISTPDGFVNVPSVSVSEFVGQKVVLVDFWTYSCINCQRTLPYLNDWYKKYEDDGLVIIGVHTPEFSFERVIKNVEKAVADFGIKYPVVIDNDFSTWNAYKNRYWPRKYLVDIDGYMVYDHAGEGAYAETERKIQDALRERAHRLGLDTGMNDQIGDPVDKVSVNFSQVKSPETYFGAWRNENFGNGTPNQTGAQTFVIPDDTDRNVFYLGGPWSITSEYAEASAGSELLFKYESKDVYMVASSTAGAEVEVYVDGALHKTLSVKDETLYTAVSGSQYDKHTLKLRVKSGTLKLFTFTFG